MCGSPIWRGCSGGLGLISVAFSATVVSVSEASFTTQISRFSGVFAGGKVGVWRGLLRRLASVKRR